MMTLGKNYPRHNRQWREPAGVWEARPSLQSRFPRFIIETLPKHARSESGSDSGGSFQFSGPIRPPDLLTLQDDTGSGLIGRAQRT
jgi:hypothetical protein